MKNILFSLFAAFITVVTFSSCNKKGEVLAKKGELVASNYNLEIDEPDSLLLDSANTADTFTWTVTPAGFDTLRTLNNAATIVFTKSGTYTVSVSDNGAPPVSTVLKVNDSVFNRQPVNYTNQPLTGDQINLTPHYYKSLASDSSSIYFTAQTTKSYCSSGELSVGYSLHNSNFQMDFLGVTLQPGGCTVGQSPRAANLDFSGYQVVLTDGTYTITCTLNGKTYNGSALVTDTDITFTWNYTSGILLSPTEISR